MRSAGVNYASAGFGEIRFLVVMSHCLLGGGNDVEDFPRFVFHVVFLLFGPLEAEPKRNEKARTLLAFKHTDIYIYI